MVMSLDAEWQHFLVSPEVPCRGVAHWIRDMRSTRNAGESAVIADDLPQLDACGAVSFSHRPPGKACVKSRRRRTLVATKKRLWCRPTSYPLSKGIWNLLQLGSTSASSPGGIRDTLVNLLAY
ncbi:hypothetical protein TGPRC2_356840 [Toxoplasma gondii TgCatPRC2]|uniref:Uncharacterized protein n=1 Tax=Toxoplasma gondii TgCatPRC2 TaxID=1130821 RepID=A0A151GYZ8_TOXGO|nr:hypothetical protein TGPRC2_356840 [Toxoplasma gondii TgCatPRC2]